MYDCIKKYSEIYSFQLTSYNKLLVKKLGQSIE